MSIHLILISFFYRWLLDEEHAKEKDEALQKRWVKVENREDMLKLEESLNQWRQNSGISTPQPQKYKQKSL